MPDQLQLRGGTTTEHNSFTGALREVTVDTTKKTLVVHDGSQAGGTPLMKEAGANGAASVILGSGGVNAFTIDSNQDITFTGASANVVFDKSDNAFEFADNAKAVFGAGGDLNIFHDGADSHIHHTNNNNELKIRAHQTDIKNADNNETQAVFHENGAVELYYDNSKKFETTSNGVSISGDLELPDGEELRLGNSNDLQLFHDGSDSNIYNASGNLRIRAANNLQLETHDGEMQIKCVEDGAVELYYDNVKRLETLSTGVRAVNQFFVSEGTISLEKAGVHHHRIIANDTGNDLGFQQSSDTGSNTNFTTYLRINDGGNISLPVDNQKLRLGASADLQLYHNGSNSYVANSTGQLVLEGDDLMFMNSGRTESLARFQNNGAVELYFDNSKKAETNADGFRVSGALQSSSGTGNYYLRTAHTTIQEGGNSATITVSGLTFSWGVLRIGGYASAGQASVSLHILFGGYFTHTNNYNATVLANHAQGCSISLSKNNSDYVVTITNNAANYDLFCNMMIESANSAFAIAIT